VIIEISDGHSRKRVGLTDQCWRSDIAT
jgi:hypothetical protein